MTTPAPLMAELSKQLHLKLRKQILLEGKKSFTHSWHRQNRRLNEMGERIIDAVHFATKLERGGV